ncbi:DUF2207 domain-containing protein [Stappia taiwanensis]|uniref:DUF2207 domain-containing protein n=1 Tax=Stappia taiwanensis TaxID=992267 RepID=A0A838XLQ4_9HYPH|nr:DUF2207 domain-containing protein [Stappia taiwanensis]MBA4612239.1 DUF2207 domain-containing protein [Stappia taiwanensis]GGE92470.1 hypothetical protein GCM10007285_20110 [Stappia taiwanensis]
MPFISASLRPTVPLATLLVAGVLLVLSTLLAQADERILSFSSTVDVAADGTFTVTEAIKVRAEGNQIRRGIFRDLPLTFEGGDGRRHKAGFELVSVERDGVPDGSSVNHGGDGVRIYIGNENTLLSRGEHTYRIVYKLTRLVRFFDTHDEIYWNATGNEWAFPIDRAAARIILPEGTSALETDGYTGAYGDTGKAFSAREEDGGRSVLFTTTQPLGPGEGISVVVTLPAGSIARPGTDQKLGYFFLDYRAQILGGFGILLVLGYYLWAWWTVGRDPPAGVIFPRFEPPAGLSPALTNYIANKGFGDGGWGALSAACLSLAVKGRLHLDNLAGDLTLQRPAAPWGTTKDLPHGEAAIAKWLDAREDALTLNKANGKAVQKLGTSFRSAIEGETRQRYFKKNRLYLIPGIALSVGTIFALLAFGRLSYDQISVLVPAIMSSVVVVMVAINIGRAARRARGIVTRIVLALLIFTLFSAGNLIGAGILLQQDGEIPILPLIAVALIAVNLMFGWLLGAPTALGRKVLDEIEGLKMYLNVAEKDRLNMTGAPSMSPSHFETLLPYAVALGVEKPWATAFQTWLASAAGAAQVAHYSPRFYSGSNFDSSDIAGTLGNTLGDMSGSFSSSLPTPKSSSSGSSGGGFSGGGGGGGGGGGW